MNDLHEKIIVYIKRFNNKYGYPPRQGDVAKKFGISKQRAHYYFQRNKDELMKYAYYRRNYFK